MAIIDARIQQNLIKINVAPGSRAIVCNFRASLPDAFAASLAVE